MLELKKITKSYSMANFNQTALNEVSIAFREKEFVSILGPSGSGKTTLLNIVGGLDKYDDGDLIINGISTKKYTDRDWDTYRNHSIGFVFQSYNLIGHQSILSNVEMALTLAGVSKKNRKKMAIEALQQVGLSDHINKKPNQLSGGQMQRVAIARALVNNPDIILADEPTGALDSDTSVQIMDLLKEISKNKLVIMVTHNPELAETYSTRIIRVKDGSVVDDSDPFIAKEDTVGQKPKKKTSMSFFTALSLSFNNLLTKKGRTALTAFAGSIGIIGIALILAISTGVQNYIDEIQRNTLSSYPIQIEKESTDMSSLLSSLLGEDISGKEHPTDAVYANPVMYKMMKQMLNAEVETNNLEKFKVFLGENKDELSKYTTAIQYGYDLDLNIYATDPNGEYAKADFMDLIQGVMGGGAMMNGISSYMSSMGSVNIWEELLTDPNSGEVSSLISDQYDLIYGKWPKNSNEILLVLTENNEISDITLYSLGLVDQQTMMNATIAAMTGKENTGWDKYDGKSWAYEDICNIPLKMVLPTDYYQYDESAKLWVDISDNQALLNSVIDKGLELKISGIIKPKADATSLMLSGSLCYTPALTNYYIEAVNNAKIIKEQKLNVETNVISGLPFILKEEDALTDDGKIQAFKDYVSGLSDNEKAALYERILSTPSEEAIQSTIDSLLKTYEDKNAEDIINDIVSNYAGELGYSEDLIRDMLSDYTKDELITLLKTTVREMIISQHKENAAKMIESIHATPSAEELETIKDMLLSNMYKSIAELPEIQQEYAKHQIHLTIVAQSWCDSTGMTIEAVTHYLSSLPQAEFNGIFNSILTDMAIKTYSEYGMMSNAAANDKKVADAFDTYLSQLNDSDFIYLYDNHMPDKTSDLSHEEILDKLGVVSAEDPSSIYIYPLDFEMKSNIAGMIDRYNENASEDDKIEYVDIAAMLMSSVSSIITAISVVLISFVSISLFVSSIMIGIITYISVLERTKEIGILRAVGASKKDISRVFNAETMIVGFLAGMIGIITTVLLCIPISSIAQSVTGIASLKAVLPTSGYFLILLSMTLTFIAGLFPAKIAAKKDPVLALRTE